MIDTDELRRRLFLFNIGPTAAEVFEANPALQSAVFCVARVRDNFIPEDAPAYLGEERIDAWLLYTEGPEVDLKAAFASAFYETEPPGADPINLPSFPEGQTSFHPGYARSVGTDQPPLAFLRAFGAYCPKAKTADHFESKDAGAHAYQCIARLRPDGTIEHIGTMLHPELDGLPKAAPPEPDLPQGSSPHPERSAALRSSIVETMRPAIDEAFASHACLQSITLCVAQYWNDEASDAVHGRLLCSVLPELDFDAVVHSRAAPKSWRTGDPINLPGFSTEQRRSLPTFPRGWPSNTNAIAAFAAYCREGGSQHHNFEENYRPILVFLRDGSMRELAPMLRPWLDGVPGEREQSLR